MPDYSVIDQPPIINLIFYPRADYTSCPDNAFELLVPVGAGVSVAVRFFAGDAGQPWILYFHGNGEVASDYDDIAPVYNQLGLSLAVADYRGYGASSGTPTFTDLCRDARQLFTAVTETLAAKGYPSGLWLMGRSIGSLSALEVACHYQDRIKGLIIESGFANVVRVMKHLDHFPREVNLPQFDRECQAQVQNITIPALILHGQDDTIVPVGEAKDLFDNLGSAQKKLFIIPGAGHNDIMFVGLRQYFEAIQKFIFDSPPNAET